MKPNVVKKKTSENKRISGRPKACTLPNSIFGKKLRSVQGKEKNEDFAKKMSVTQSNFTGYIRRGARPSSEKLMLLRSKTGVDLNWLCMDADDRPGPILLGGPGVEASIGSDKGLSETNGNDTLGALQVALAEAQKRADAEAQRADAEARRADLLQQMVNDLRLEIGKKTIDTSAG